MKLNIITSIILKFINESSSKKVSYVKIDENISLLGDKSALDSLKLIELCLILEDQAEEMGFEFDWTSEKAMSKSRSIFRTPLTLAQEFLKQSS